MKLPDHLAKQWMTQAEAEAYLGCSRATLYRRRRMGLIEARRFNNGVIVKRADIERFLKTLEIA